MMPENQKRLMSLTLVALDEYYGLVIAQELLEICLEQLDEPTEGMKLRLGLLVSLYLTRISLHLDELRAALEGIRRQLSRDDSQ